MTRSEKYPMSLFSTLAALLLAVPVLAHDDDPKILHQQAPIVSLGFRPAAYVAGGSLSGPAMIGGVKFGNQASLAGLSDNHVSFPSSGMELISWLPLGELGPGAASGNDCWGYISPSNREYAMIGTSSGTAFVDLTSPSDPVVIHYQIGETSLWRDVKIYQQYAYIVSEGGGGIQVMDLGQIDNGVVTLVNTIFSGGTLASHNVAIDTDSGYLYRCGGSGRGLRVYSLSNPSSPNYVGSWNSRYVHDVQVKTYTSGPYAGRQIAFACSGYGNGGSSTGLTILDVTNKNNIWTRAQFYYPNPGYSHQAWLSEDLSTLYLNDELDENGTLPTTTHVIDVSNLGSPYSKGTFTNGNKAIGHNLYIKGNKAYEANYRSGLRIFDVTNTSSATESAYFDTWPGDDAAKFNGLWSCYPFFPSGLVLGSDRERGLFVLWEGDPKIELTLASAAPTIMSPAGGTVDLQITELNAGDLEAGTEKLYYDIGSGLVEASLTPLGGGAYRAQFPAMPCGGTLRWFVSARSTDNIMWTLPKAAPYDNFETVIAESEIVIFEDDFEIDRGWSLGSPGDTATAGIWLRGDPVEGQVSPGDDHTPGSGVLCMMTGLLGEIDGGFTTLTSPVFDTSGAGSATISFWMQFRQGGYTQGTDRVDVEISNDGGSNWIQMERVNDPPSGSDGTWAHYSYQADDWVTPSATTQVRFKAFDVNLDSQVKALVDDFRVTQVVCPCETSNYCVSDLNSNGTAATIFMSGTASVSANNMTLHVTGALPTGIGLFFYGGGREQIPLAEGTLCVNGGISGVQRLQPPLVLDGAGAGSRYLDLTQAPADSGPGLIAAGSTWDFQFWYRDPSGGPGGSNLSDGLEVTFCH